VTLKDASTPPSTFPPGPNPLIKYRNKAEKQFSVESLLGSGIQVSRFRIDHWSSAFLVGQFLISLICVFSAGEIECGQRLPHGILLLAAAVFLSGSLSEHRDMEVCELLLLISIYPVNLES
jgi:hypothetical protein